MDPNTFPTKGNLILAKNSLALSRQGFELMDKKRNILIREMMELIDQAKDIQAQIDETFRTAYAALQNANMELGIAFVQQVSYTVPVEDSVRIKTRSVMGTEIPLVEYDKQLTNTPTYAYYSTRVSLDQAKAAFEKVKELSIQLAGSKMPRSVWLQTSKKHRKERMLSRILRFLVMKHLPRTSRMHLRKKSVRNLLA